MSEPKNPYAFPGNSFQEGMTLRDWFAGQALSSVMATVQGIDDMKPADINNQIAIVARLMYQIADAMLVVREQGK